MRDQDGRLALDLAIAQQADEEAVRLLLAYLSPVHAAVAAPAYERVLILELRANPHRAAEHGQLQQCTIRRRARWKGRENVYARDRERRCK